jgi:protein-tyrosine-phosphatase
VTRGLPFPCVANAARRQLAEGIARDLAGDPLVVPSAGSELRRRLADWFAAEGVAHGEDGRP